jgi:acyl-[acyl-carrier-protein]-phospholipid O-acyltransferase/long-chain-fatty-acid--[acyl-carrier-protein] ligase
MQRTFLKTTRYAWPWLVLVAIVLFELLPSDAVADGNVAPTGSIHGALIASATSLLINTAIALAVLFVAFFIVFALFTKTTVWCLTWLITVCFYRLRIYGQDKIPDGGALLVSNHLSWLDGVLLIFIHKRPIRMMVYSGNFKNPIMLYMAGLWKSIMIGEGPKVIAGALRTARQTVSDGGLVCIFAEGGISRTGTLQSFKPGSLRILKGTDAPVVPIYLDQVWGSIFSFERGRFFWKWPKRWRYPISVHYGDPLYGVKSMHEIRQAVQAVGAQAMINRMDQEEPLQISVIRACKKRKFRSKIADSAGSDVTGGSMLMRALILRRLLVRHCLKPDEKCVGVLIPPSTGGAIVNLALSLDRRVAVNLNYTVSSEVMNECIRQAGITSVLTSRKVMEKMDFDLNAEVVYLDDLREKVTTGDKISSALAAYVYPTSVLAGQLGLSSVKSDDLLTIIFTSGSTGIPKGVMLTQANIRHNVDALNTVVKLVPQDVFIGILPFFHSFGYTITFWGVSSLDIKGAYHFNPLDARQVAKLCKKHKGTILLSTPTFLRSYLRRCDKEDFESLDAVVAGAEKLPKELSDAFEKKFGVRPVEGYGATETAPLVSVNIPPSRSPKSQQIDLKEGTVGRPVPGVAAKTVNPDTFEDLDAGEPGMLLIKGANVMKGYLNQPEKTAEVVRDGWYVTGDIAEIDEDGFIRITGRQSRFSKIGGEMVPHIKVEESLIEVVGVDEDQGPAIAVTAVPDEKKGERLIVLYESISKTPDELRAALKAKGLPNIYIPSTDSFYQVDEIPVLGTGKLDLKGIQQMALDLASS